jgi:hypothetical protein
MATVATSERHQSKAQSAASATLIEWRPPREIDARTWASAGRRFGAVGRGIQWLLGDWIAYGNSRFGERYARASKITGYDTQTLMNMVYVASRFPVSRRRENLSWSHHEALAAHSEEEQERWLDGASANRWSVADLRMMLRTSRKGDGVAAPGDESECEEAASLAVVTCPRCGEEVAWTHTD